MHVGLRGSSLECPQGGVPNGKIAGVRLPLEAGGMAEDPRGGVITDLHGPRRCLPSAFQVDGTPVLAT